MAARERRKIDLPLIAVLALPAILFAFTLGRYYGHYYDNKFFNMLALELWERPFFYFYLGSHYHVPSSLYSYIAYPFFYLFSPGDLAMETPAAVFHTLTVYLCYRLGHEFHGRAAGLVFALLVALSPIHLVQVYTLPDLSFAIFLNAASLYFFMTGLKKNSAWRMGLSAVFYSLGCFQAIYSVLLLPFYFAYSAYFYRSSRIGKWNTFSKLLTVLLVLLLLPAYTYFYLLAKAMFFESMGPYLMSALPLAVFYAAVTKRLPTLPEPVAPLIFPTLSLGLLAYFDLAVQLDCIFNKGGYGFYMEAAAAGGYGGRPPAHFMGRQLSILGYPLASSVLTSILDFAGKDIAKISASLEGVRFLVSDYFLPCFPSTVMVLAVLGVFALSRDAFSKSVPSAHPFLNAWPLVLLAVVFIPFVNLGPSYFNIRRIYILPLPMALAALGAAGLAAWLEKAGLKLKKETLLVIVAVILTLDQARFSIENIFVKYSNDKKNLMYFKLFYGHFYGRSYRELGEFLLKDAPLKKDGAFRAALVYTIPEDTTFGRSLPLFNSIDWYTENQLMVLYDFKDRSRELYGDETRLKRFLGTLFEGNPALETVYFVDFVDEANNLSFFSKAHQDIKPYATVDDDGSLPFDGVLFRFDKGTFQGNSVI